MSEKEKTPDVQEEDKSNEASKIEDSEAEGIVGGTGAPYGTAPDGTPWAPSHSGYGPSGQGE